MEGSAYLGRFQQGQEIPLTVQCTDAADSPDIPSAQPEVKIWRDGATPTVIEVRKLGAYNQGVIDGLFRLPLFLGWQYSAAGRYLVVFKWIDSNSVAHTRCAAFTLNAGGDAVGSTIGLHYVERPNASYLIRQTDAGVLIRSKNPR